MAKQPDPAPVSRSMAKRLAVMRGQPMPTSRDRMVAVSTPIPKAK